MSLSRMSYLCLENGEGLIHDLKTYNIQLILRLKDLRHTTNFLKSSKPPPQINQ